MGPSADVKLNIQKGKIQLGFFGSTETANNTLTISLLGQLGRLQLISQTSDLVVGHGQPAGTLLQVQLQTGTLPRHAARLASQLPGLGLKERDTTHQVTKVTVAVTRTSEYKQESSEMHAGDLEKSMGSRCIRGVVS